WPARSVWLRLQPSACLRPLREERPDRPRSQGKGVSSRSCGATPAAASRPRSRRCRCRLQDNARVARRIGILTAGGDCPGLNAVIRAAARRSMLRGWDVVGVREGWRGLVEGIVEELGPREISGLLPRGGTIL